MSGSSSGEEKKNLDVRIHFQEDISLRINKVNLVVFFRSVSSMCGYKGAAVVNKL